MAVVLSVSDFNMILPNASVYLRDYVPMLVRSMMQFDINTPQRAGGYIAQCGHESNGFRSFVEYGPDAGEQYENRADLGNLQMGDGKRFKGRGPIQLTGRDNYRNASIALFKDMRFIEHPEQVEDPAIGFLVSAWWWKDRGLNAICDLPEAYIHPGPHQYTKIQWMTVKVNGGLNGFTQRNINYQRARTVLNF